MPHLILLLALSMVTLYASAGTDLSTYTAPDDLKNIHVQPLSTSKHASEFIIFIKSSVKAHYHEHHTELIYVLEGEGIFYLGETKQMIKAGDFIRINEGQVHSVKVTSETPLKVLSIQAPEFHGKDRVFVESP